MNASKAVTSRPAKGLIAVLTVTIVLGVFAAYASAEPIKFARYPNAWGDKIAFTYHGDIWVANADGSAPRRLTDHIARDTYPRFSPDGRWIAFSSNRMGNDDLYVIPTDGGPARQITFHTAPDMMHYWTPDGTRLIFSTSLGSGAWGSPLHTVDLEGGQPVPMDHDRGAAGMISQDGRWLAFNRMGIRYWRKHYKGNASADIWLQDLKSKDITQLTDLDLQGFREHRQDLFPMWGADGMIYFLAERDGVFNIWKISPRGGAPAQVTVHETDGVQFPSISPDGKTIVYENEFEIWRLDVPGGEPRRVPVDIAFDDKHNSVEYLHSDSQADGYAPSPDGRHLAVDYHGEIFLVPSDPEVGEKTRITDSPWRDRYQAWSPDGHYLSYVSDESLEEEFWLHDLKTGERRKLTAHESSKGPSLWSRDSKRFAFTAANRIFTVEVPDGTVAEVAHNPAQGYRLDDWSPDGRWLVYSRSDENSNTDVFLFDTAARTEHNVTANPFRDSSGALTPDGKTLIFLSNRDNGTTHLFAVSLARVSEDPDDPLVRERREKAAAAANERRGGRTGAAAEGAAAPTAPAAGSLVLETGGIDRRAIQLTRGENGVGDFFLSDDGKKIYYTGRDDKGPGLFVIDLDGRNGKKAAEGQFAGLVPSGDRKTVFFRRDNALYKMTLAAARPERLKFAFSIAADRRAEWAQMFEECWRVMKYRFYDENMHGFDWAAIRETYRPLLKYVGENEDLYDLANEMIGELNASHTGVSGPTREMPRTYRTRHPGFDLEPAGGFYRVSHVYWDGPADKEWLDLEAGDYVLAIDGREIRAGDNYLTLLNETLNDYVTVRVNDRPEAAGARDVRIKAVDSIANVRYEEWVKTRRDIVDQETGGRIAYVHIRSMNQPSLRRFENEISRFADKQGLIVDIRYNGGGNIDQELLDILERRPYEFWNNRWGTRAMGRRPRQAIVGPKVMLINWRSASDSEVTPMGFRDLGLGRIVGNPTNGSVIATGSYRLINGGSIRTPGSLVVTWDPTKPNNYGINLENYGVAPDVWVENTPEDELKGYDRELHEAIAEALRMLENEKSR